MNWLDDRLGAVIFAIGQLRCDWHEYMANTMDRLVEVDLSQIDPEEFTLKDRIIELVLSKYKHERGLEFKEFARLARAYTIVRDKNREIINDF